MPLQTSLAQCLLNLKAFILMMWSTLCGASSESMRKRMFQVMETL